MVGRRAALVTSSLLATAAVLSGCSQTSSGQAVSIYHDPFRVAGLDASSGPSGLRPGAPDAVATEPVSFCPSTNTIGINVDELAERGTPGRVGRRELMQTDITGDYNAYVLLASRYTLAMQQQRGQALDTPQTALRAACLAGVITAALSPSNAAESGAQVTLSPGDLDEAVSGLLTDGLAASDVNGDTVPSGFARVDAFRTGVLGGQVSCDSRYTE